jgi:hypothetical protein
MQLGFGARGNSPFKHSLFSAAVTEVRRDRGAMYPNPRKVIRPVVDQGESQVSGPARFQLVAVPLRC